MIIAQHRLREEKKPIIYLPPLEKGLGPSFEKNLISFTQGCFVLSLVEIGQLVLEKKIFKFCQFVFAIS